MITNLKLLDQILLNQTHIQFFKATLMFTSSRGLIIVYSSTADIYYCSQEIKSKWMECPYWTNSIQNNPITVTGLQFLMAFEYLYRCLKISKN